MSGGRRTSAEEAQRVGDDGVEWDHFDLEQFRTGMDVEYEHGSHDPQTDGTGDDPILTGKIALAHTSAQLVTGPSTAKQTPGRYRPRRKDGRG